MPPQRLSTSPVLPLRRLARLASDRVLYLVALAFLIASGSGCALLVVGAAAGAGAAGYAYANGELKSAEAASLNKVYNAAISGLKDLEFPLTSQKKDALQGELTARNSSDKRILIKLKSVSSSSTEIRIRVGTFGDEALSRAVYDKIKNHL